MIVYEKPKYCEGDGTTYKLLVNKSIDSLIDILAVDIRDDLKSKYLLNNVWQDVIIDYFYFTKWPTEIITIYRLTE